MIRVKVCGIMELEHTLGALDAGADMLGFVFAPSKRRVVADSAAELIERSRQAFPPTQRPWRAVGVFAGQPLEEVLEVARMCALDVVQLSGEEGPEYCRALPFPVFKTVHVGEVGHTEGSNANCFGTSGLETLRHGCGAERLLLDSGGPGRWGGTGKPFGWEGFQEDVLDCMVAGGLTPTNVGRAISTLRPWGVDVSSGVERDGRKNLGLIRDFIQAVRECESDGLNDNR